MAMYNYEEEVRSQVTANLFKIAFPVIVPLYLVLNISDWIAFPDSALLFLFIRLSLLPVAAFCYWALKNRRPGPWHALTVWILSLTISAQMSFMAYHVGWNQNSIYFQGIGMIAAALLLPFPLQLFGNLATVGAVYAGPLVLILAGIFSGESADGDWFSSAILHAGMGGAFCVLAIATDRFRFRNFEQKNRLFYIATTDALSGLKLRRYFFNRFVQELSLRLRKTNQMALSVAMIDLDSFKALNDRYGHQAGDQCIRQVGEIIRNNIRIYDVACRFGGEEFAILLPETTIEEAVIVTDRIRRSVETNSFYAGKQEIAISVSGGVSGIEGLVPESIRDAMIQKDQKFLLIKHMIRMIKNADDALYEAKSKGKNRILTGEQVAFTADIPDEEMTIIKSYLPYFDQSVFLLHPEGMELDVPVDAGINFYPEEYFFRRCVEGIYRWFRDPEWDEVLAILSVKYSDQEAVQKVFHKLFRLSDATSSLGDGHYGVVFFGMPPASLAGVRDRVFRQLAALLKTENFHLTIAAAPLRFDLETLRRRAATKLTYEYFLNQTMNLFKQLKSHRFAPGQSVYYQDLLTREKIQRQSA